MDRYLVVVTVDIDTPQENIDRFIDFILNLRGLSNNKEKRRSQINKILEDENGKRYYGYGIRVKEAFKIEIEKQELLHSLGYIKVYYSLLDPQRNWQVLLKFKLKELGLKIVGDRE